LNPAHAGNFYLLTGPQSLTQHDKVRLIGQAIGRDLSFVELSPEQVRQAKLAGGHPEEIPDRLLSSLADYAKQPGPRPQPPWSRSWLAPHAPSPNGRPTTPPPPGTKRE
jgi:uncharacterized protein YbjT (DUF2867 family)